jgi:hypothetical protein
MAKDLTNEEDVQQSLADSEGSRGSSILKIPEGRTPVYILKSDYSDGYAHWVQLPEGPSRVVCSADEDHKGWDPQNCPLCKATAKLYGLAKQAENKEGKDDPQAKRLRQTANRMRAKYEAHFLAAQGELVKEKVAPGKYVYAPDFSEAKVGVLSMTRQQYNDFTAVRSSPDKFPFMKGPEDLVNRAIVLSKAKRQGSDFATIEFIPAKRPMDPPEVEYEEDDFDLDADFEADPERVAKMAEMLEGVENSDDAGVEFEDDAKPKSKSKQVTKTKKAVKKAPPTDDDFLESEDEGAEEEEEEPEAEPDGSAAKEEAAEEEEESEETEEEETEAEEEGEEEEEAPPPKKHLHSNKVKRHLPSKVKKGRK